MWSLLCKKHNFTWKNFGKQEQKHYLLLYEFEGSGCSYMVVLIHDFGFYYQHHKKINGQERKNSNLLLFCFLWYRLLLCCPDLSGTHYRATSDLTVLALLLPESFKDWDYNHALHCLTSVTHYHITLNMLLYFLLYLFSL